MTVSVSTCSKRFYGSGSTGPFTWTWRFLANADIQATKVNVATGEETSLLEGAHYNLTGAGSYQGGSLTLLLPLLEGEDLIVKRNTSLLQMVSIRNQGNNFRPEVHEDVFDRLTMMIQEIYDDLGRAILMPIGSVGPFVLPITDVRNKLVGFDNNALPALFSTAVNVINIEALVDIGSGPVAIEVDATAQPLFADLPVSGEVVIAKKDASANAITIRTTVEGQTIGGGGTSIALDQQGQAVRLLLIGTNWYQL